MILAFSTFAWYQATTSANASVTTLNTATATTKDGNFSAGAFKVTITPVVGSNYNKLAYVDSNGKTAYYSGNDGAGHGVGKVSNVAIPSGCVAEDTGTVTIGIAYEGSLTSGAAVDALWATLNSNNSYNKISFTLKANNNGHLRATGSGNHAYDASGAATLACNNVGLGSVTFVGTSDSVVAYTKTEATSFLYCVMGADELETGTTVTISVEDTSPAPSLSYSA